MDAFSHVGWGQEGQKDMSSTFMPEMQNLGIIST